MILLLDNYDSFTYNLVDYFARLNVQCVVLRNSATLAQISKYSFTGIVLSPGPEVPEKAGVLMEVVEHYHNKLPMLGICLGHQAIGQYFGGKLTKAEKPMHGKISGIYLEEDPIFNKIPSKISVVRYHSLIIEDLPPALVNIAKTRNNELMAVRHVKYPIWGLQFHPEAALTEFGLEILKNWLDYNNISL